MPYWRKLLEYQVQQKKTGFTIPFLIGAKSFTKNPNLLSIKELIYEAINYNDISALYYCNDPLKEFTITTYPSIISTAKEYYKFKIGNLIICKSEKLNGINEIDHVIETLEVDYKNRIENSEFDKNDKKWSDYTKESKDLITNVLKNNEYSKNG